MFEVLLRAPAVNCRARVATIPHTFATSDCRRREDQDHGCNRKQTMKKGHAPRQTRAIPLPHRGPSVAAPWRQRLDLPLFSFVLPLYHNHPLYQHDHSFNNDNKNRLLNYEQLKSKCRRLQSQLKNVKCQYDKSIIRHSRHLRAVAQISSNKSYVKPSDYAQKRTRR